MKKRILSLALTLVMVMTFLPVTKAEAAGSATGQQIVDCAMQYLGKVPYVWGGEKIDGANPGADCSGFICRIYEKFGFNFWANRTKLRNCGTNLGTNLNVAQKGDIIWYDGHVAIYAGISNGNHMIIHETGGKYQNVVYTKASIVSAELKGVIRIPGITNSGSGTVSTVLYTGKVHDTDGNLAINDKAAPSPQSSKEIGRIPEGATCVVYTNKTSGNWWWVEYNGIQGWAYGKYITKGAAVKSMQYLDVNGYLDGKDTGNISGAGTVDVYINGFKVANDCSDYYKKWPQGTKYEIKDVRVAGGYSYDGIRSGSASGTIGSSTSAVRLAFSKPAAQPSEVFLDLNGYLDGKAADNITGYGTVDVYINGRLISNDVSDFYGKYPSGTSYEIKDIRTVDGSTYQGVNAGSLSGTLKTEKSTVVLKFSAAPKVYTAHFYCNEHGNSVTIQPVTQGKAYGTLPEADEKEGYTFDGYYTAKTGGTKITSSTVFNGSGDVYLYPRYTQNPVAEPQEVTIYYYTDGNLTMTQTSAIGDIYASDYMVKDGYTFLGWYSSPTGGTKYSGTRITEASPRTLYAQYAAETPQQYTVYLYMNGYVYKTLTVTNGSTYGTLPSPKMDGYEFLGWYTSSSGGTKVTSSTKVNLTGSQTLYARFEEIPEEGGNIILQINNPTMYINGRPGSIDAQGTVPVIRSSRTLLPVRAVFEAMGGTVGWDNATRTVSLEMDGKTLYLQIDNSQCKDSLGKTYTLDSPPAILNSRTMLPIRFVVEYFGGTVDWDGGTQSVIIQYKK